MFRKGCGRLLLVLGATALVAGCLGVDDQDPVTIAVSKLRYFEIVPPSSLHFPGTINSVEVLDHGRVVLHPTCEVDQEKILKAAKESEVPESQWSQIERVGLSIKGIIIDLFSSKAESTEVKDVSIEIENPRILVISDAKLREIKIAALEEKACEDAVRELVRNGTKVCQIRAALKGDVEYSIAYKEGMLGEVSGKKQSVASGELDLFDEVTRTSHTSGKGVFFAARLSEDGLFFNDKVPHDEAVNPELFKVPKCPQL